MPTIAFSTGPRAGQTIALDEGITVLGRSSRADIGLSDDMVSGQHAEIVIENGRWRLKDRNSSNGTLVNGQTISTHWIENGDDIQIGASRFVFRLDGTSEKTVAAHDLPEASPEDVKLVAEMRMHTDRIRQEFGKVIVGQRDVVEQILMCIIAHGHALLIGLPGMAKTLMVRTLASILNLKFKRVQFTPDLMPTDIVGTDVLVTNQSTGEKEFRFLPGPVFCNLLLADEINRTPPKTQAALLEAMQEKRVTAGNVTYPLEEPFFVLATQNPIEQEGTYPLPEAQLDRFMFNIWVDYPEQLEEEEIVRSTTAGTPRELEGVMTREQILRLQSVVRKIPVSDHVIRYAIRLVRATRPQTADAPEMTHTYLTAGAGPRAGQYLILAAKAMAVLEGRIHVSCNDIRRAALPVLRHRLITNFVADSEGKTPAKLIEELIATVREPSEEDYGAARS